MPVTDCAGARLAGDAQPALSRFARVRPGASITRYGIFSAALWRRFGFRLHCHDLASSGNDYVAIFKPVLKRTRCRLLMALTAFILELVALWFQHVMLLQPCVMYLRTLRAVRHHGRGTGGRYRSQNAAALCRHGNLVVQRDTRTTAGVGAYDDPAAPFTVPDLRFRRPLPNRLPLDKWLPQVFVASGDCSVRQWQFLSLEMPQWLVGIFAAYLLVAILVIVAQPFKAKNAICLVVKPRRVQPTMKRPAFLWLLRIAESFHVYG